MNQPIALIIDDNKINLQIIADLIQREGFDYVTVSDSRQTTATLNELPHVEIVFLDLEMPGLNGYDVLALIQNDSRFNEVPVVAYTVHVSEAREAFNRGFHSFLAKPIDQDLFPEQLRSILSGQRVWAR